STTRDTTSPHSSPDVTSNLRLVANSANHWARTDKLARDHAKRWYPLFSGSGTFTYVDPSFRQTLGYPRGSCPFTRIVRHVPAGERTATHGLSNVQERHAHVPGHESARRQQPQPRDRRWRVPGPRRPVGMWQVH